MILKNIQILDPISDESFCTLNSVNVSSGFINRMYAIANVAFRIRSLSIIFIVPTHCLFDSILFEYFSGINRVELVESFEQRNIERKIPNLFGSFVKR
ncbi:hypothetical protein DERP_010158 [Dermatophagoides pteronyssinus]|uniref:Uncharacterized protein n=1 Tax=Dermatophagoides pteronyssinus TaxID=6956 RepID=A0ABQ8J6X9_DERPT|nr:hypothetical protein DERP_010158 [Dermatophagoides pteronyssinus]